jgi:hypothetical protein
LHHLGRPHTILDVLDECRPLQRLGYHGVTMNNSRNQQCAVVPVRITAREFIRLWQTSNSVAEVAMKTRTKKNAVRVRAYRYRKLGIPLKDFPYVEVEVPDWDKLAEYAESLLPDEAVEGEEGGGEEGGDDEGEDADRGESDTAQPIQPIVDEFVGRGASRERS